MNKKAYYSDYIWFDGAIHTNSWLLTDGCTIEGIYSNSTPAKSKENSINTAVVGSVDVDNRLYGYERIIYKESSIFPSLINTHTHLGMAYFRGIANDMPLMDWLNNHIWPRENKLMCEEFVSDATKIGLSECIRSGVGCVNDMYFHPEATANEVVKSGMRGTVGFGIENRTQEQYFGNIKGAIERFSGHNNINVAFAPHALYTVSPEAFKDVVKLSQEHNILIHAHLAETEWEVQHIVSEFGKRPALLMDELGIFDCRSILAHCVHVNDDEIKIMGDKGVSVSHCLESNLKLASGFAPITALLAAGANVTIGTDSVASNNDLDMISEMRGVALFHKGYTLDASAMNAKTTLECATLNASKALHLNNIGELKKGYQADFMVVNHSNLHMQPLYDPLAQLIYSAKSTDVTDLVIAGKELLKDGQNMVIDEAETKDRIKYWQNKINNI